MRIVRGLFPSLLALSLLSCRTVPHPNQPVVHKFRIEGMKQVKEGELRSRVLTTETFWLTGWLPNWFPFSDRQYFDESAWETDLRRVQRVYQALGFYEAKVVSNEVTPLPNNSVDLKLVIHEGEPTKVDDLELRGLDDFPPELRTPLLKELPVKVGDHFKEDEWAQLKAKLIERLREDGYAEATVSGEARVDLARHQAKLTLQLTPGTRYRFDHIQVKRGPKSEVPAHVIEEQARAAIPAGNWYSDSALASAQGRVSRLGVFGAVRVTAGTPDHDHGTIPVIIDTNEAPFRTVRSGGGIGIDPVREEARVLGEYVDRNFLGGLRNFTLTAHAGYALIDFVREPNNPFNSGPFYSVSASFTQPHFLARDLRLTGLLESSSNIQQAYRYLGGRASLGLGWHPNPYFAIRPSYNFEADRLWGVSTLVTGNNQTAAPELTFGCASSPCNVFLSYLEEVIEWDRRDNVLEPRHGYYLSLSLQEGGLGGSFAYLRVQPDLRYYQPIGQSLTLAMRLRAGTLIPLRDQDSPIVARFFSGGANSMRGFATNRLSPLEATLPQQPILGRSNLAAPLGRIPGYSYGEIPGLTIPIGGNGLFEASVELRWQITRNLVLAFFSDAGLVTRDSFGGWPRAKGNVGPEVPYFQNMQYALGFGLRYLTPLGPIRLDLAHRLDIGPPLEVIQTGRPIIYYPTQGTCFGIADRGQHIAGAPEGPCAFHISIGEAF